MEINLSEIGIQQITSQDEINIENFSKTELVNMLSKMLMIRNAEYKIAEGRKSGIIGGPVHLGVGQEAVSVAISQYLNNKDMVFGVMISCSYSFSGN